MTGARIVHVQIELATLVVNRMRCKRVQMRRHIQEMDSVGLYLKLKLIHRSVAQTPYNKAVRIDALPRLSIKARSAIAKGGRDDRGVANA